MLPFFTYKKTIIVNRNTYQLFNLINDLDLRDSLFKSNPFDLISSVEQSDPLILKFRKSRNISFFSNGKINATLWSKFENINSGTKINIELKSNFSVFIPLAVLLLSLCLGIIRSNINAPTVIAGVLIVVFFACMDLYAKSNLLNRFESMIQSI